MDRADRAGIRFRGIVYKPLPSQSRFHESDARFKGFSGPVGSGKSQALCQEAVKLAYVDAGRLGLIGAPTYPMLRDVTQATLLEILESNRIPVEFNKAENLLRLTDCGSRILFRAVDEFERLRGTNLAWFGLDELTYSPEQAWLVLEGRLRDPKAKRLCGFGAWTPRGYDWVYRKFVSTPAEGYQVVLAQPFENRYLPSDFYERLRRSYDEEYYQQEVLGAYLSLHGGRVYRAFDRREHVRPLRVDHGAPLLWTLDFNVDPMCSLVAQISRQTIYVLAEIVLRHSSTEQACVEFYRRYPDHPSGVVIYGDASGGNQQTTGASDYQMVREYLRATYRTPVSYKTPSKNPFVRERINLVNSKLRNAGGEISLVVDARCEELIQDFESVSYKPDSVEIDKTKDPRRTHLSDALGYLIWEEFRPRPKIGEQDRKLPVG